MAEDSSPEDIKKAVDAIYAYAAALLEEGKSRSDVILALVAKGIEESTASVVVDKLIAARGRLIDGPVAEAELFRSSRREEGSRNMVIGGLICGVGLLITFATFSAASSGSGGGHYVVAWGAILFGAIRFFRGLSQMNS